MENARILLLCKMKVGRFFIRKSVMNGDLIGVLQVSTLVILIRIVGMTEKGNRFWVAKGLQEKSKLLVPRARHLKQMLVFSLIMGIQVNLVLMQMLCILSLVFLVVML